jgi:hypothetical protein
VDFLFVGSFTLLLGWRDRRSGLDYESPANLYAAAAVQ